MPFIVPRIQFDHDESAHGVDTELLADSNFFSADAVSVVAQPTRSTFLLPRPTFVERSIVRLPDVRYAIEATIFPGLLLLAGFVVYLIRPDRRRLPLWVGAAVLFVFGLGPSLKVAGHFVWKHGGQPVSWLPYRLLLAIPGLGALRAPVRVEYVLVALLVAATTIALTRLVDAAPARAWVVGVVAAVLLATNLLAPVPRTTFGTTPAGAQALRAIARHRATRRGRSERSRRLRSRLRQLAGVPPRAGGRVRGFVRRESVVEARGRHRGAVVHQAPVRPVGVRTAPAAGHPGAHDAVRRAGRRCAPAGARRALRRDRPHQDRAHVPDGRGRAPGAPGTLVARPRRALRGDRPRSAGRDLSGHAPQEQLEAVAEVVLQAEVGVERRGRPGVAGLHRVVRFVPREPAVGCDERVGSLHLPRQRRSGPVRQPGFELQRSGARRVAGEQVVQERVVVGNPAHVGVADDDAAPGRNVRFDRMQQRLDAVRESGVVADVPRAALVGDRDRPREVDRILHRADVAPRRVRRQQQRDPGDHHEARDGCDPRHAPARRARLAISASAAGRSTTTAPLTHARCAESARCSACGSTPRPNSAPASSTRGRSPRGSRRTRQDAEGRRARSRALRAGRTTRTAAARE